MYTKRNTRIYFGKVLWRTVFFTKDAFISMNFSKL